MRSSSFVLVLTAALGGIASAQPGPPPTPPPPPADTSMTTTDQSMTTTDQPQPEPTPQPAPQPVVAVATVDDTRPSGVSIGLGIGYALPTSLETPNRTSARLRLASGLTLEPLLSIANTRASVEQTAPPPMPTMDSTDKLTEFGVALLIRLPFVSRGKVDLEGLGTAGVTFAKDNPDGDYNTVNTTTLSLGWGVGVGYWLSPHWQLSMSVTNPLIQYEREKRQTSLDVTTTSSDTTLGLIFVPQVTAMIHLYN